VAPPPGQNPRCSLRANSFAHHHSERPGAPPGCGGARGRKSASPRCRSCPEEMDRALLPMKPCGTASGPVDVEQHAPEAPRIVGVIGMWIRSWLNRQPCDLARQFVDLDPDPELRERRITSA